MARLQRGLLRWRFTKMPQINPSISRFLDALAAELQRSLAAGQPEQVAVSWDQDQREAEVSDLAWWSCALSVDPACRIYAGANRDAWREIGRDGAVAKPGVGEAAGDEPQASWFAPMAQSIERAAKTRFGALVSCRELGISEECPSEWARVSVAIDRRASATAGRMFWVLSPELMLALGGENSESFDSSRLAKINRSAATNSLEILQHVQLPVSISFGRTHMMLKDLLNLANGSVVNLDREMGTKSKFE
jgi:flagellar motor switch/type III secretory pathway protein FliN